MSPRTIALAGALALLAAAPSASASPPGEAVDAPTGPASAQRARVLERAVRHVADRPDVVEALDVGRGLTTAVFELSCAATLLIPDQGELPWYDVVLGVGCLGASVGLFIANGQRLGRLRGRDEARARVARLAAAAADGLDAGEAAAFEAEIDDEAARTRRTRAIGMSLGGASWVATGVLSWATATDRIDARAGTAIAIATFVAGALGLSLVLVESPAERASRAIERWGGADVGGPAIEAATALRLFVTPWADASGAGLQLSATW